MFALFALLPSKDWLYLAAIAALLCGFGWYTHKERAYGAAHELAAMTEQSRKLEDANASKLAKQAAADATHITAIENLYAQNITNSLAANSTLAQRLRDAESAARRSAALSGNPATAGGPVTATPIPAGVDDALTGVISAAGHDADQVIALQAYISDVCLK